VFFAPAHDRFTSKTAICPYDDSHFAAKTLANGGHDFLQRFNGPITRIALLAALAGLILAARLEAGQAAVPQGWELDVIAAVIIG
jgi:hypothetical protein